MTAGHAELTTDDGVRLSFRREGEGSRTLLVLNGFYTFEDFAHLAGERTVVGLDLRNRGHSERVRDPAKLARGVEQDADDIEAVRQHLGTGELDLLAHSYAGLVAVLYAVRHPSRVGRIVQIGPVPPEPHVRYPARLTHRDGALEAFMEGAAELQERKETLSPAEFCRAFWTLLRPLYVFDPADARKLRHWEACDLATELSFTRYWSEFLQPSIERLAFTGEELAGVTMPVLVVHGRRDRSAPYGGGRDWALRLPNARLLTVEDAAHAPWIEAPDLVPPAIRDFLDGAWPEEAEKVEAL